MDAKTIYCRDTGSATHDSRIIGADGGPAPTGPGGYGLIPENKSLVWHGFYATAPGIFRVCWCPASVRDCSLDDSYLAEAGVFNVSAVSALDGNGTVSVRASRIAFFSTFSWTASNYGFFSSVAGGSFPLV